jgi:hypothetical protein
VFLAPSLISLSLDLRLDFVSSILQILFSSSLMLFISTFSLSMRFTDSTLISNFSYLLHNLSFLLLRSASALALQPFTFFLNSLTLFCHLSIAEFPPTREFQHCSTRPLNSACLRHHFSNSNLGFLLSCS